ncbi:saccharopine dehydrogenase [Oceanicella actignis]|uniref:saccharopine dehydrogenase n=1 Tax=Oceanicella actignis TaxID=1189325 RepID=UPI0011E62F3F|nr:saccharopine dehydrogenase [Oceanicella actignis]TYO90660.1 saccharopine dehydrogenase (NAD+, L-lysine forming) [Oceanicella actignis]
MKLHLRDEARATERRAPLAPDDAAALIAQGASIAVERSDKRVFPDEDYARAGCALAEPGSWTTAPRDVAILGLKELPPEPRDLPWRMIHFAHVFKRQSGWADELARFRRGGGALYDLEYLTGPDGRRVAAFGYWAGWTGAALGLWRLMARELGEPGPEAGVAAFESRAELAERLRALRARLGRAPKAIVIGALGRSGRGAADALAEGGAQISRWDIAETAALDADPAARAALLGHELLVNCVLMTGPGLTLATPEMLPRPECRLRVISDVSCDPFSDFNPLPLYLAPTGWDAPFINVGTNGAGEPVELTAIDNLPSLIPRESSLDFSAQLTPALARFPDGEEWQAARAVFLARLAEAEELA